MGAATAARCAGAVSPGGGSLVGRGGSGSVVCARSPLSCPPHPTPLVPSAPDHSRSLRSRPRSSERRDSAAEQPVGTAPVRRRALAPQGAPRCFSGSHHSRLAVYHSTVSARPWSNGIRGAYPRARNLASVKE